MTFKSIILETDQRKISPFIRFFWEKQQKYLQSSQHNATYYPMNLDTDVTYQAVNLFSSDKCLVYVISNTAHYIWWNQHNSAYKILVDILDLLWRNDMFIVWNRIMKINNAVYTSYQNSTLLFVNGLIFDIMNIQITSLFNLNENQC